MEKSFGEDLEFLKRYSDAIELSRGDARIIVVPNWQGRTMTSTARGQSGTSYGYVNHDHIASGEFDPQINLYGGEDRMWISPEGGQFSIFFDEGVPLEYANWRAPQVLDTAAFEIIEQTEHSIQFSKETALTNYSGFEFQMKMEREVKLHGREMAAERLGTSLDGVDVVFHESHNRVTNTGDQGWRQETGLIGIWMLCMNKPSPNATLIVPFMQGSADELGAIVNADYFGKLDESRLMVDEATGLIFLLGDGNMRSKLGLTFARAQSRLGSWDNERGILSVVDFNLPASAPSGYTNNLWEIQDQPYAGDVTNCYNDGPNESGGQLGGFFELETISPALALNPGDGYTHIHSTIRMEGDRDALDQVAKSAFGTTLEAVESQFGKKIHN